MGKKLLVFLLFWFGPHVFSQEGGKTTLEKGVHYTYINQDSAYFFLDKARSEADRKNDLDTMLLSYLYLISADGFYFNLDNFKEHLDAMDELLRCDPRLNEYKFKQYYQNYQLFNEGSYYYIFGEYDLAERKFLDLYQQLSAIPETSKTNSNLNFINSTLSFLGKIYYETGKINLAKEYYHKKIDLTHAHWGGTDSENSELAYIDMALATLSQREKNYAEAEKHIKKAILYYQNADKTYASNLISSYFRLAKNHLLLENPDSAMAVLQKMDKENRIGNKNLRFSKEQSKLMAQSFAKKRNFEKSLSFYQTALSETERYFSTQAHPEIAEIYSEMGQLYADHGRYEKSLATVQKSLSALSPSFDKKAYSEGPEADKVSSKLVLITVLNTKLKILLDAYAESGHVPYLKAAHKTSKKIISTLDALKPEFETKVDIRFLLEETYPAFYKMMETAFLLYQKTGNQNYLNDAFYFSEKSRAVLLLSAVQSTNASQFSGVPKEILNKEKQLAAEINHLEKKQFENKNNDHLKEDLFLLKNKFYSFLNVIEKKYPKYHRLKYKTKVPALQKIQEQLRPEEAILDYYLAEDHLYYFIIEKENVRFDRVPFSNKSFERIRQLQKYFSNPRITTEKLKTLSGQVYRELIPKTDPSISSLIILRSGILNYIPFEALYNKQKDAFLLEEFTVSYANSATLYHEYAKAEQDQNAQLLAFAPNFTDPETPKTVRAGLDPLLYNTEEVQFISDYFPGEVLLNAQASLAAFEKNAEDFGILHLATHAIIDDKFPDYSYLAFSHKDSFPNLLYIKDLYNYDLNADLVVLSACETGVGKLQKGEGLLSLARGFNYAGASSLVTTQWKISDKSTSSLMKDFYKNLAAGQPKNTALRNAKLKHLQSTDDVFLQHPYYWAGFVLTGNTSPITEPRSEYWMYILIAAGLLVVLIFFFRKRNPH